jgi:hypothetical protein
VADMPKSVPATALAKIIGVSDRRVRQLVDQGIFSRAGRGLYRLAESVQAYVAWRLAAERGDRRRGGKAADRVQELRAREIEQRIGLRDRTLIRIEDHDAIFDEAFGMLKAELIGLPARITRDLAARRSLETEIDGALNRAAKRFEQKSAKLRG